MPIRNGAPVVDAGATQRLLGLCGASAGTRGDCQQTSRQNSALPTDARGDE